jgi:putative ABC transport system permease protein
MRVVVIGDRVANNVFKNPLGVGSIMQINNKTFRVVGVLASSSGFGSSDNGIAMSSKDARDVLNNTLTIQADEYSSITVKVTDANYVNETSTAINAALANSHHVAIGKEDFSVTSAQALQQRFNSVTGSIALFLAIIAAVSLLVGGIGVANTMFTAVLEKTRDIGVMKAIGAKNSDILLIFLMNSGLLGLIGGIFGIIGGVIISSLFPLLGVSLGIGRGATAETLISPGLLIGALLFSMLIGMVSGAIPAYKASKLNPVEALRYE